MEDSNRIRQKNALISQNKEQLRTLYMMIDILAQNASHNVFNKITKSAGTRINRWTRTGILLEEHDAFILNACIPMLVHYYDPVLLAIEKHFFNVLAAFIEVVQTSRSTVALSSVDVAETVCVICSNARLTLLDPFNRTKCC
jgi:hypothetical protein